LIGKGRYLKKSLNTVRKTGRDLSLCHKYKFLIPKSLQPDGVISNKILRSNRTHILKYLRSTTLGWYDVGEFKNIVCPKTHFLWIREKGE